MTTTATFTLVSHNINGSSPTNDAQIVGTLNFGATYAALDDADLLALVNTALAADDANAQIASIKNVVGGPTDNGSFLPTYDRSAAQTRLVGLGQEAAAETLAVTSHETPALAAEPTAILGVEVSAGGTAAVNTLTPIATPAATKQAYYNPATKKIKFHAADAATEGKVAYFRRIIPTGNLSAAGYDCSVIVTGLR